MGILVDEFAVVQLAEVDAVGQDAAQPCDGPRSVAICGGDLGVGQERGDAFEGHAFAPLREGRANDRSVVGVRL